MIYVWCFCAAILALNLPYGVEAAWVMTAAAMIYRRKEILRWFRRGHPRGAGVR